MGMRSQAIVAWGFHLNSDDVLAIIKALKEQEKEQIKQEEKQTEEKSVQDNRSSIPPNKSLEEFLYHLVPTELRWSIIEETDSDEGETVLIYTEHESTSVERWGYQNCMLRFLFLPSSIKQI
jgi:hypothetical protein